MNHRSTAYRAVPALALIMGLAPTLSGCILLAAGAGAGAGYEASQERGLGETGNDIAIRSEVSQSWTQFNFDLQKDLDATVYQGRVLITGRVPSEEWRAEAVKRAWQVKDVKEVYDEIEVGPTTSFGRDFNDGTITTRLRSEITFDSDIRSVNYSITTVNGVVYLMGSARTQAELDAVMNHARNLKDVKRVISFVKIRPGAGPTSDGGSANAGSAPPPPAPAPPAPTSAPAPSNSNAAGGTIEATPLK
ncbi:MAG TPA: BON domain-containing protein [Stellaceae bacterium]|nr:BON domain-containing protein [Stellaceae bacterium]